MTLPLERAKTERNVAHAAFHAHLAQVQEDLAARGIGGRVVDRAGEAMAQAVEVANENRGVVAGTIAALALWFLRGPIIAALADLWSNDEEDEAERNADDD